MFLTWCSQGQVELDFYQMLHLDMEGHWYVSAQKGRKDEELWKSSKISKPNLGWRGNFSRHGSKMCNAIYRDFIHLTANFCMLSSNFVVINCTHVCQTLTNSIYHHIPEHTHSDIKLMQLSVWRICLHQQNKIRRSFRSSAGGKLLCSLNANLNATEKNRNWHDELLQAISFVILSLNVYLQNKNHMQKLLPA